MTPRGVRPDPSYRGCLSKSANCGEASIHASSGPTPSLGKQPPHMEPNREAAAFIAIAAVGVVYWWWVRRNMPSRKCDECDQTESDTRAEQSRAELVVKEPKIAAIEAAAVKACRLTENWSTAA